MMEEVRKKGKAEILMLPKEVEDYIDKVAKEVYAEKAAKDPELKKVLDSLNNFLDPKKQGKFIPLIDGLI